LADRHRVRANANLWLVTDAELSVRLPTGRDDTKISFLHPDRPYKENDNDLYINDLMLDFEVHIDGPGLTVRGWTSTWGGDGLDHFFAKMDADFRGWRGIRHWRSMEGNLTIDATHTGRHVALDVSLSNDYYSAPWKVVIPAVVSPGEEFRQLAADVHDFVRDALSSSG